MTLWGQSYAEQTPEGLTCTEWQGIKTQITKGQYKTYGTDTGSYRSANRTHGWVIDYGHDGMTTLSPDKPDEDYHISLRLDSVAHAHSEEALRFEKPMSLEYTGDRMNYHWSADVIEYWINSSEKLEQWFEIKKAPSDQSEGLLQVEMVLDTESILI